jgi:hypothetical protein
MSGGRTVLHFETRLNDKRIGYVRLERLEAFRSSNATHSYRVTVYDDKTRQTTVAYCSHRYCEGQFVLIRKAMEAIELVLAEVRRQARRSAGGGRSGTDTGPVLAVPEQRGVSEGNLSEGPDG